MQEITVHGQTTGKITILTAAYIMLYGLVKKYLLHNWRKTWKNNWNC